MLKKILSVALLLVFVPTSSFAKIGSRNLEYAHSANQFCVKVPVATTSDTTRGLDGVMALIDLQTYGSSGPQIVTSSIAQPPVPMKVRAVAIDSGGNDTITCTLLVVGIGQFGEYVSESISVTETVATSANVFSRVDRLEASSCAAVTDAADDVQLSMSLELGLGRKIKAKKDVVSACIEDAGSVVQCAILDTDGDGTEDSGEMATSISMATMSIDASDAMFAGEAAADNDVICLRVQPSFK